jgi:hypothetical protein
MGDLEHGVQVIAFLSVKALQLPDPGCSEPRNARCLRSIARYMSFVNVERS